MTETSGRPGGPTPLSRAMDTIRHLKAQLAQEKANQPVAVVGAGMRMPGGVRDLDGLWEMVSTGRDAVVPVPESRRTPFAEEWDSTVDRAGFLDRTLDFDAGFFGISPREARAMDPQHRLLLEVSWEALENAAMPPDRLGDARTGVYVGVTGSQEDYRDWSGGETNAYWSTGNGHCFAAGRVSYALGLTGPAVAVDTACSSSLVAMHQAAQALRTGECDIALAGGVSVIMSPRSTRVIQQTGSLAPDGRCKAFDARANGFGRGEGSGMLVLKRLDRAEADGDQILAVLRGSAVNQDGRSSGFTAPNVLAQVDVIRRALADAELTPADVGLVETHGTGTSLGDPIEMEAIAEALARSTEGAPLRIGALKNNIGHLEAAAGVAGVLKAIACLRAGAVAPLANFSTLNPRVDVEGTGIVLPTERLTWDTDGAGAHAGISSFGMSGTNAHLVVGPAAPRDPVARAPEVVPGFDLTAAGPEALRELAAALVTEVPEDREGYAAFAYTLTQGRFRHRVRAHVRATDPEGAVTALRAVAEDRPSPLVEIVDDPHTGVDPALEALPRSVVELPSYPWQRERHAPSPVARETHEAAARPTHEPIPAHRLHWQPAAIGTGAGDHLLALAGDDATALGELLTAAHAQGLSGHVLGPVDATDLPEGWSRDPLPSDEPVTLLLAHTARPLPQAVDPDRDIAGEGARLCAAVTEEVRALAARGVPGDRAHVLTRATRRVTGTETIAPGPHGLLNGLAPALGLELGQVWGGTVDLPAEASPEDTRALLGHVLNRGDEDTAAIREGAVLVPRVVAAPDDYTPDLPVRSDSTYLVTGGLGGVGRVITENLVERGARHLLLVGRRPGDSLGDAASALLERLGRDGVEATYVAADCDDPTVITRVSGALASLPELGGVVHCAGSLPHRPIAELRFDDFAEALRGKYSGTWWLHLLTRDHTPDFFLLTSSASAQWGSDGHAAYAAANAGIDGLAAHRAALGLPAMSLAFGLWGLDGMADDESRAALATTGLSDIDPDRGGATLTTAGPGGEPHLIACPVDWDRFTQVMATRRERPLFDEVVSTTTPGTQAPAEVARRIMDAPERARADQALRHVATVLAETLGHADSTALRADTGFYDLGLDSVMAVDLVQRLSTDLGLTVEISEIFDHPTIEGLAAHLYDRLRGQDPAPREPRTPVRRAAERTGTREEPEETPRADTSDNEPVAIVGMAGRFPGADDTDQLWDLLSEGGDAVAPIPAHRWEGVDVDPANLTTDRGGFLSDIAGFDAAFFGVPAREAQSMDPQHRLLLQSAWHAVEDSGTDPSALRGSRTGVVVGLSNSDYSRVLERGGPDGVDAYFGTGTALNAAAGRISYLLGLHGPALAVDTACSSSLVALHLAIGALRNGESDRMIVGGANVLTDPTTTVATSRAHMLSPDGRCKTFSADADGFGRAEGCGVVVLKRLGDARRDGDRVLAVLRGSAVNQDGASTGLTAPSGRAQEAVIGAALDDAGATGDDIDYLEAHGTGTSLGDPIEVDAAWNVLGRDREPDHPLLLGSIKSNIGHAESAAGMAALFKTVLALRHGRLPASLHCDEPNPHVPWDRMNVRVVTESADWSTGERPRLAGVSGFGFSGTNAHIVVEEAPPAPAPDDASTDAGEFRVLLPLSAPDNDGLDRLTGAWRDRLSTATDDELPALAAVAGAGRAHLPVRRAVVASGVDGLRKALAAPHTPSTSARPPRVAFLFSGQGSQYFGMGRELYETEPVFADVVDRCDRALGDSLGASITDLMFGEADPALIDQTRVTQPALVTLELALAALWESWGVRAVAVMGHSVGEVAAAVHAGVLGLEDAMRLIRHRAELMQGTQPGAMLSVALPFDRVQELLEGQDLDVAAVNGPESVVVAGARETVDAFAEQVKGLGAKARALTVSHAFHSRLMEPMLDDFTEAIAPIAFDRPQLPIVANVTGDLAAPDQYTSEYWRRHVRRPVRFHEGVGTLAGQDIDAYLEIGPGRTLLGLVRAAGTSHGSPALVASMRRGGGERALMLDAAAELYALGQDLDWRALRAREVAPAEDVPLYPFADTPHWAEPAPAPTVRARSEAVSHWGEEVRSPALSGRVFAFERSADLPRYLTDHRLYGTVVTPAASHLATVLSALAGNGEPLALNDLLCPRALVIDDHERHDVQLLVGTGDRPSLSVQSLADAGAWQEHVSARITTDEEVSTHERPDPAAFTAEAERHIDGESFYSYFHDLGYTLGPSFKWIDGIWIRGDEALVRYRRPALPDDPADYELYPGLIDSCFQSIAGFMVDTHAEEAPSLAIPFAANRLSFPTRTEPGTELWGHVRVREGVALPNGRTRVEVADLHMFTEDGDTLMAADRFRVRHASRDVLQRGLRGDHLHVLTWQDDTPRSEHAPGTQTAVLGATRTATHLVAALDEAGFTVTDPAEDVDLVVDARFLDTTATGSEAALAAVQDLAATLRTAPPGTVHAVLAEESEEQAPVREALWGMLAALETEDAGRRLLRVTLADGAGAAEVAAALATRTDAPSGTRVRVTPDGVQVARLARHHAHSEEDTVIPGGAALITGGTGALGLSVARRLAGHGVDDITLMARSAPDTAAREVIDRLTTDGTTVRVVAGSVTDPDDCARAVTEASADAPLHHVFHLAGATADGAFHHMDDDAFRTVFAPKASGADRVVEAVAGHPLRSLVLFSSVSSFLGAAGQANYAAANGYLNGLAASLRARGVPATAVAWGPWEPDDKGGLAADDQARAALERAGLRPLTDRDAWPILAALPGETPAVAAMAVDFARYAERLGAHPAAHLVADLSGPASGSAGDGEQEGREGWLRARLTEAEDRHELLRDAVRDAVGTALGTFDGITDRTGFADLGMDSIMVIDLRGRLGHALGLELPSTIGLDHPTVEAMAGHLEGLLPGETPAPAPVPEPIALDVETPTGDLSELSTEDLVAAARAELMSGE